MQTKQFWIFKFLVFLVVFICLPLPHGNIYPFIALIAVCVYRTKNYPVNYVMIDRGLIAFFIWGLASMLWSIDASMGLKLYGKVVCVIMGGWIWLSNYHQFNQDRQRILQNLAFIAGLALLVSLLILVINLKFKGQLFKLIDKNVSQALVHACIACGLAIWLALAQLAKWLQVCILLIAMWTFQQASSDAAALGILLGTAVLAMHKHLPRLLKITFIYGMPLVWGFIPFVFCMMQPEHYRQWANFLDPSNVHRLFIWDSVTNQIFERFLTGFGFGSSRFQDFGLKSDEIHIVIGNSQQIFDAPVHPHNFMLQIWLELGAIGVMLASLAWILYWQRQYHKSDSYYIAFWASILCVAATNISIWQSWWLFLVVVLLPMYTKRISGYGFSKNN